MRRLPRNRSRALDVGCGQGRLLRTLAARVGDVTGTDVDAEMRRQATERCARLTNVQIVDSRLGALDGPYDVVTTIAVLHHLDDDVPTAEPTMPYDELRAVVGRVLPGARMRRRLGFRHTIEWERRS
ncbi:class I SAM-dependent methyltransferase [Georgenia sp. Z1491]|uniref:class I SAM-dependent methyltransferase n=1 Tax=Georgenia sp. Z1491 TaxID=3416707 RepID=UPI003CF52B73